VDKQLAAAREIADQRGVPARVLAVEMILAATEAITGVEGGISREALGFAAVHESAYGHFSAVPTAPI